jgi:hypothetical protein
VDEVREAIGMKGKPGSVIDGVRDLVARASAAEGSAARYLWLRNRAIYADPDADGESVWCVKGLGHGAQYPIDGKDLDAELDAAIDAARAGRG